MEKDELKDALEEFERCLEAEEDNRKEALDDLKFARLSEQWTTKDIEQRRLEGRPCLTINKLPSFIRQVVNDGRQNKPSIKVHPADSEADPATAEIINGLIRNIEYTSGADVAYDTGLEFAVTSGVGYWRVSMDYSHDDTFDMDLNISRISNPFSVYGDPYSTSADSSDWNISFITDSLTKSAFQSKYKGAEIIDWKSDDHYSDLKNNWCDGENIIVAERWKRTEIKRQILQLSNGNIVDEDSYKNAKELYDALGISVTGNRPSTSWKVVQNIMSGAEILETNDWVGKYIPIVPIYGEEVNIEGKRYFRSMIRDAKDAQRQFNFWRTAATEAVGLQLRAPFVGKVGAFDTDIDKWTTANTRSHSHIEYDGDQEPQRQQFSGPPAGALQEALNASDDMKAVMGLYDASLGARSNETSGVAINARKREGDTSTFHFIDNQARAIAHTGRILIDLIPHVYNKERIIRVMGEDKKPRNVSVNQPQNQQTNDQTDQAMDGADQIYNLSVGKYDLTVSTGLNFQTQREETAAQITEFIKAFPQSAPFLGDILAKSQDWPEADEVAKRLQAMLPPQLQGQNPQVQQMQQQLQQTQQEAQQHIQGVTQELQKTQQQLSQMQQDRMLEQQKLQIDQYNAETNRLKAHASMPQQDQTGDDMNSLSEAQKLEFEASTKIQLEQMRIDAAKELKLLDLRVKQMEPQIEYDENFMPKTNELSQKMMEIMQSVSQLQKIMAAPKEIIRDENGRPIGSRSIIAQDEPDQTATLGDNIE